jgi:hypothetical protein
MSYSTVEVVAKFRGVSICCVLDVRFIFCRRLIYCATPHKGGFIPFMSLADEIMAPRRRQYQRHLISSSSSSSGGGGGGGSGGFL